MKPGMPLSNPARDEDNGGGVLNPADV